MVTENFEKKKETCNFVKKILNRNIMITATKQIEKQIDWQFPNEKETTTIDDFREMVRNSENASHISLEEFCKVTDE